MTPSLCGALAARPYPGRVCLAGRTADGTRFWAYALTGRSVASRSRALVEAPDGDIEVRDVRDGVEPDALRHYVALARRGEWLIIGNGGHVVPLCEDLEGGVSLGDAWAVPTFEPDPPIYTPRIWLGVRAGSDLTYLGWVRRGAGGHAHRGVVAVDGFASGSGVLLTTYEGSVSDVRTSAIPVEIGLEAGDIKDLSHELWDALSADLRVGGLVRSANGTCILGDPRWPH